MSPEPALAALYELHSALETDGRVPLAWVVAHAPDGDIAPLWSRAERFSWVQGELLQMVGRDARPPCLTIARRIPQFDTWLWKRANPPPTLAELVAAARASTPSAAEQE